MRIRALLGAMLAAVTLQSHAVIPASEQAQAVEFYHAGLDHYFITADATEKADLDTGKHPGWVRTGYEFPVIKAGSTYAGSQPVCRFYADSFSSHFYSAKTTECNDVKTLPQFKPWSFESGEVFRVLLVDAVSGQCPADTKPVTRLWNNRADSNHRYSDQYQLYQFMTAKGYVAEGDGPATFPAAFCAPTPGSVVPATAAAGAPDCMVTVTPNANPAVNTSITMSALCTNSPTSLSWQGGCSSTSDTCTTTEAVPSTKTYTLYASNAKGPALPTPRTITWGASAGALPICSISASNAAPTVGTTLTLSTTCSNTPTKIEWRECNYLIQDICNVISSCPTAATSCTITASSSGLALYGVDGVNASGTGPIAKTTVEWIAAAGGGGGGGGGTPPPAIPSCSIIPSETAPLIGTTVTLFANCTGTPTSFTWTGAACSAVQCTTTSSVPGTQTYSLTASNSVGTSAPAYVDVNWRTSAATPFCTVTPSNSTPQTGTTITLSAKCSNNPTTYAWTGCTSNSDSCTDSVSTGMQKTYTLVASNGQGTGNTAQAVVNWTAPATAKPSCTITASNTTPTVGQQITLDAKCGGAPTAYAWTGCSSTTNTCIATATVSGKTTYYVAGTNQYGTGDPAGVQVTWQPAGGGGGPGNGGSDFCGSYQNVIRTSVTWNERAYVETTSIGGFAGNGVLVVSFVVPSTPTSYSTAGRAQFGELFDGPTFRQMTLSKSACDFRPYDPTGANGPYTVSNGTSAFMIWNVGAPPISLAPGQTYYFNVRNYSVDLGATSCSNSQCNGLFEAYWPR